MRPRFLIYLAFFLAFFAARADAKSYSAERFDVRVEVLRGGSLRVTETVVFRFVGGTFTEVFRQIPSRKTDGFRVERVSMDGAPVRQGDGPGSFALTRRKGQRVVWRFAPVSDSTHVFEITYVARGVAWQGPDADIVAWRVLPTEHDYTIATSTFEMTLPVSPLAPPVVEVHRGAGATVGGDGTTVQVVATTFRSNGWMEATVRLPRGSVIEEPPDWQQRQAQANAMAPTWLAIAGVVFLAGLVALFAIRQGYDVPPPASPAVSNGPARPDTLPPGLAGALVSNGRSTLEHAMATLFALADRGDLHITEEPRKMLQRNFLLVRTPSGARTLPHEQAAIEIGFTGKQLETEADITKVRGRLARRFSRFSKAVSHELLEAGLLDQGRQAVRNRFRGVGIAAILLGAAAGIAMAVLAGRYGAWPLSVVGACFLVGLIGFSAYAAHTPLSNEGVRRAREWRGFQRYLKDLTSDRTSAPTGIAASLLPFAVTVGLAAAWSKFLKGHRSEVPAWFRAIDVADQGSAFAAFVAVGGSQASHGAGGAGAGSAAGGGASGAH